MSKSKICIISLDNLNRVPYINVYKKVLTEDFDVIYWNRANMTEECGASNYYRFSHTVNNHNYIMAVLTKLSGYISFRRFVIKVLKENNYLGIIPIPSNCAVLLYSYLLRKYKNKYIVEVRDYWKENQKWYYNLEKNIISNSFFTAISSAAYKKFLPEYNYVQAHNLPEIKESDVLKIRTRKKITKGNRIILSCIGGIKHACYDKEILKRIANDIRFEIRYIGRGYEVLQSCVNEIHMKNAYIEGCFPQEKTIDYYIDTDVIVNLYGNNTPTLDYALSNKLYYAALFHMPILVCPGTAMADIAVSAGFGFVFDKDDPDVLDKLYSYCINLDYQLLGNNCDQFIRSVRNDMSYYEKKIKDFEKYLLKGGMV